MAFESVDSAFDGVPGSVVIRAEPGRAAASAAAVLAVLLLVCWFGNGAGDAASAQVSAVCAGAVGLVGPDLVGPCAGTACADARDIDAVQDGLELGRVAALPGGHDQGQHLLALFTSQVDLRGQPAAGASQRVVVWFCREATGRLLLLAGVSAGAGGVLVRRGDR